MKYVMTAMTIGMLPTTLMMLPQVIQAAGDKYVKHIAHPEIGLPMMVMFYVESEDPEASQQKITNVVRQLSMEPPGFPSRVQFADAREHDLQHFGV